jgi:hypothetical protein
MEDLYWLGPVFDPAIDPELADAWASQAHWKVFYDEGRSSDEERALLDMKLDPSVVFQISRNWLLKDLVPAGIVRERILKIKRAASGIEALLRGASKGDRRDAFIASVRPLFDEWEKGGARAALRPLTFADRSEGPFDWRVLLEFKKTGKVDPAYRLHPAEEAIAAQGNPSARNRTSPDLVGKKIPTLGEIDSWFGSLRSPELRRKAVSLGFEVAEAWDRDAVRDVLEYIRTNQLTVGIIARIVAKDDEAVRADAERYGLEVRGPVDRGEIEASLDKIRKETTRHISKARIAGLVDPAVTDEDALERILVGDFGWSPSRFKVKLHRAKLREEMERVAREFVWTTSERAIGGGGERVGSIAQIRDAVSSVSRLTVSGVGRRVPNPEAERLRVEMVAARKRAEDLGNRDLFPANLTYANPFDISASPLFDAAGSSDDYTSVGFLKWTPEFTEDRRRRLQDAFSREIGEWYLDTLDALATSLARAGWKRATAAESADPQLPGNDVRRNALNLVDVEVLQPLLREADRLVSDSNLVELPLAKEDVQEMVSEYLDAVRFDSDAESDRTRSISNVLRSHPPPGMSEAFAAWLSEKGLASSPFGPADRRTNWIERREDRGPPLRDRAHYSGKIRAYLDARMTQVATKKGKEATEAIPLFLALHFDALVLEKISKKNKVDGDLTLRANLAPDQMNEANARLTMYRSPATDPAYDLLVKLAAYPDPGRIDALERVSADDVFRERKAMYETAPPDDVGEHDAAAKTHRESPSARDLLADLARAVKRVLKKYYARPLAEARIANSKNEGLLPIAERWFKRMAFSPDLFKGPDWAEVQRARYEERAAKKGLEATSRFVYDDSVRTIQRNDSRSESLEARIDVWPPGGSEAKFEWKRNGVAKKVEDVSLWSGSGVVVSTFKTAEPGTYVCDVSVASAAGVVVAEGRSASTLVARAFKCSRCGGQHEEREWRARIGRDVADDVFSEDCAWKALAPQSGVPRLKVPNTLPEMLEVLWEWKSPDTTREVPMPRGGLLLSFSSTQSSRSWNLRDFPTADAGAPTHTISKFMGAAVRQHRIARGAPADEKTRVKELRRAAVEGMIKSSGYGSSGALLSKMPIARIVSAARRAAERIAVFYAAKEDPARSQYFEEAEVRLAAMEKRFADFSVVAEQKIAASMKTPLLDPARVPIRERRGHAASPPAAARGNSPKPSEEWTWADVGSVSVRYRIRAAGMLIFESQVDPERTNAKPLEFVGAHSTQRDPDVAKILFEGKEIREFGGDDFWDRNGKFVAKFVAGSFVSSSPLALGRQRHLSKIAKDAFADIKSSGPTAYAKKDVVALKEAMKGLRSEWGM